MSVRAGWRQRWGRVGAVAMVCALAAYSGAACSPGDGEPVTVPSGEAAYTALDPALPEGPALAVLSGDPTTGPSAVLLRLPRGGGRLHVHSSSYHLMLLEGRMKHWAAGENEADAQPLEPGSYWFQPGGEAHADTCLSEQCVMFVKWEGRRDARPAG